MENDVQTAPETTPIYDISGQTPVLGDIPHDDVHAAVASGKYSFPKGKDVNVVAPDGTFGTIPPEDAPNAFKNGYQYATPAMLSSKADQDKYSTPVQQAVSSLEGAAQGVAGPLAPLAERTLGVPAEDIRKRAEYNPWTHGISEAVGFGAGLFTGASEVSAIGHAGEAVAGGLGLAGKGANLGTRLAGGAAKMATEMGLYQAGDEATKAILQDPEQTVGSAVSNIGLSTLLGGAVGAPLTGLGIGLKAGINSQLLKDFTDRLAFRGSNLNPNEALQNEVKNALDSYHAMGSELGGANGLKAQALQKLMPEMSPEIEKQAADVVEKIQSAIDKMRSDPSSYPERLIKKLEQNLNDFKSTAYETTLPGEIVPVERTNTDYGNIPKTVLKAPRPTLQRLSQMFKAGSEADLANLSSANEAGYNPYTNPAPTTRIGSPNSIFDAMNGLKKDLQDYSKGNYGPFAIPTHHEAYEFLNLTKALGYDLRNGLEDSNIWGKAADLQKSTNEAWRAAIKPAEQIESKFMSRVGNDLQIDPVKFNSYVNQAGRVADTTNKQEIMKVFADAMEKFQDATNKAYEGAGVENPHQPIGMSAIRDSIEKPSVGTKLADTWHDKIGAFTLGNAVGGGVGGLLGHATGIPEAGFAGAYLGRWALGPVFSAMIKPMMEKGANLGAFKAAASYSKAVVDGNNALIKGAANLFGAGLKTIPEHLLPDEKNIMKLDERLKNAAQNEGQMLNVAGNLGTYFPDHAQAVAKTAMTAVSYLNSQRPSNPRQSPLDSEIPVSKAQLAPFHRTLEIAEQPLSVLNHIKQATLLPQDLSTIKTLYPNYYNKMSQEITNAMTDHLAKGETIPYRMRQSLSMFLGQPLDSTMSPQSIQTVQAMYADKSPQSPQNQVQAKTKKGTSKLGDIAKNAMTPDQSRQQRSMAS